ncbi:HCL028Cp [Eremothecium sinecaudum]|uniref:Transcriptional protein SWT1 n=1 Tax=Eremothecium sinecaudum TaxID=45286 RepID=A0A0X8HRJ7_9SACH|nr:HCL028Cp [Eremothecium sinecaudum]AMD20123.1 HCL028Cp [Eremothecium sinecaudum]
MNINGVGFTHKINSAGIERAESVKGSDDANADNLQTVRNKLKNTLAGSKKGKYSLADLDGAIESTFGFDKDGDVEVMDLDHEGESVILSTVQENLADVDAFRPLLSFPNSNNGDSLIGLSNTKALFVVDTNFIISHMQTLEELRCLGTAYNHKIIIPSTVYRELDGLKKSDRVTVVEFHGAERKGTVGALARSANDWIYKNLANLDSSLLGQKIQQKLDFSSKNDDAILDCCLYFRERIQGLVILLSDDKNLCMKALSENILTVSYRKGMSAQLIAEKAYMENQASGGSTRNNSDLAFSDAMIDDDNSAQCCREDLLHSRDIQSKILEILISSIDNVMNVEYDTELEFVGYNREHLVTFQDCARCIQNFWVSVFSEYFAGSNIRKETWNKLPDTLLQIAKDQSSMQIFMEFWSSVLRHLYIKRDKKDNAMLQALLGGMMESNKNYTDQ